MTGVLALLLIQASWSYQGGQGLGFAVAAMALARDRETRTRVFAKYRRLFNTNPFMAGPLVGITIHCERKGSPDIDRLFGALQSSLGASGDGFFWRQLRPGVSVLAVLLGTFRPHFAAVAFLAPFALVSQVVRFAGFERGLAVGKVAAIDLSRRLAANASRFDTVVAFMVGMLATRAVVAVGPAFLLVSIAALSWSLLRSQRFASFQLLGGLLLLLAGKLLL